ncbi:MAG: UDP-N-acetylmuramoyl-tripeptide--D-alanyl-D-alanine ligase [Ruminococcaceae bacterium]|nr:UDP-N-acetylmuramoyl-tripeptide--D-alanyl-D-alanine ligase [Oscillospiraceae bacterium]
MRNAITLSQAAQWCGGTVAEKFEARVFGGACFDTRRIRKNELFVALVGVRNGHDFARSAIESGAAAVLASQPLEEDIPAIYVKDTLAALQKIAKEYRQSLSCKAVGITGSVGKTTTKEMISSVLATTLRTQKTEGNYNNDIGLPVSVLSLHTDCQAAVLEMGMNHAGEISALTDIAAPDIAVITNVGTMHMENLGSREGILKAKLEILEGLRPEGKIVFCGDNDLLHEVSDAYGAIEFGFAGYNDIRATDIAVYDGKTRFTAHAFGQEFPVELPIVGEHNVLNALCAITVGCLCGVSTENLQAGLANFRNTGMRQNVYEKNAVRVIADCYNAGPESMRAALGVLAQQKGRRIAVLGGMLELGDYAPQAHFEVGTEAARTADLLFAYGEFAREYVRGAKMLKMAYAEAFETHEALAQALKEQMLPGDTLLFKGSRGMRMERVLKLVDLVDSEGEK